MTPEERDLVSELFSRLAALEDAERDPEAERVIKEGLRQAPNAVYALVQTALVQDEALKRADARIHELEAELENAPPRSGSFLGSMREALTGHRGGSVPTVRPAGAPMGLRPGYRSEPPPMAAQPTGPGTPGGSFLGTAAAAAAGMIGGSLLLDSIRGMMGHHHGIGGFGAPTPASAATGDPGSPWAASPSGGNLAREAGLDEIGRGQHQEMGASPGQGLLDSDHADDDLQQDDDAQEDDADLDDLDDGGGDFGGDGNEE